MLLQHFHAGLDKEYALYLDTIVGGSFLHKTPSEGQIILDRIMENTSFIEQYNESLPKASMRKIKEPSIAESETEPPTSTDSAKESSSKPSPAKSKEIQTLECAIMFRNDLDEDFGNTQNYFSKKKPPMALPPPDLIEDKYLKEIVWELTTVMSNEWLKEAELSFEVIRNNSTPRTIPCNLEGNTVGILYSPTVGVNLVSESFTFAYLSDKAITLMKLIEGFGIVQDVSVQYNDKEAILDFHVFEIQDFDVLIGHPIKKLLINCPRLGSLKFSLVGNKFSISFSQSRFALNDSLPKDEYAKEVTTIIPFESPESLLENNVSDFIEEEEDSGETFELHARMEPMFIVECHLGCVTLLPLSRVVWCLSFRT